MEVQPPTSIQSKSHNHTSTQVLSAHKGRGEGYIVYCVQSQCTTMNQPLEISMGSYYQISQERDVNTNTKTNISSGIWQLVKAEK